MRTLLPDQLQPHKCVPRGIDFGRTPNKARGVSILGEYQLFFGGGVIAA